MHIVLVIKYRKEILKNSYINNDLKIKILDICNNNNYQIIAMETDKDHIHLLLCYDTTTCVVDIIKKLKQETTYYLWQKYYNLLIKQYWKKKIFWPEVLLCVQYRRSFCNHDSKIY